MLAVVLLFVAFPGIDLWFSGLFHDPITGFPDSKGEGLEFMLKGVPWLVYGAVIFLTILWGAGRVLTSPFPGIDGRRIGYLYGSILLGPALLVNGIFKAHWGRARPVQIEQFGGDAVFTPAWVLSDQCASNCSFSSGHAALGFWTTALALLVPSPHRGLAMTLAMLFGVLVGMSRIVVGGHFLSDTVFSGIFVITINLVLYRWMVGDWRRAEGESTSCDTTPRAGP
ncbi:MAG: phosphatase PAP2 family protein [Rhodospirillum sp.]|nr:phosphatase PAP2 family protein [Rhodospirillum sp.]MCF8489987.1 phosphatase PAP2 family protein [Rhodospirillum sp.]MCF8501519.1 phosphatase PAP2 family protein [Rhodospirillum sp.]